MRQSTEVGFAVDSAPVSVVRPKMRCIMAVMDQKEPLLAVACQGWYCWYFTLHAVFCGRSQALMRCIMAGMDRSTVMHLAVAVHAGFAPRAVLSSSLAGP